MTSLPSLILVLLSCGCASSFILRWTRDDNTCALITGILCIRDEMEKVASIAKSIIHKGNEIEANIEQIKTIDTLNHYFNLEMNFTYLNVPIPEYHRRFFQVSNIDKEFLVKLFLEAHDALLFYHHSINDLLQLKLEHATSIDTTLKEMREVLRSGMICRYRSMLDHFFKRWTPASEIGRIRFSESHRLSPSHIHHVRSAVIVRHLEKWMTFIYSVIENLQIKFM